MLKDQDRIFTNLYGMHDRSLAGAKKRGQWNGTAGFLAQMTAMMGAMQRTIDALTQQLSSLQ